MEEVRKRIREEKSKESDEEKEKHITNASTRLGYCHAFCIRSAHWQKSRQLNASRVKPMLGGRLRRPVGKKQDS